MSHATFARLRAAAIVISGSLVLPQAQAATYTTPRQLLINDTYQLNPDSATGDEATTCPKTDSNTGTGGDNAYFQRTNVARAHVGGCSGRYWYTSAFQQVCTDPARAARRGGTEPSPAAPQ